MPCLHLKNKIADTPIPVGTMIVIDNSEARAYDSQVDSLDDVIGVIYPVANTSGRAFSLGDGSPYYELDAVTWNEDLTVALDEENSPIPNPNYENWNPWVDTGNYSTICYVGFIPVLSSYAAVPSKWKLIKANTNYNWYFLC